MLCERCNERQATVFCTSIIEGEASQRNLCQECFQNHCPAEFAQAMARLEAGCSYCGTKCGASICPSCLAELRRVMQLKGISFEHPVDADFARSWIEVVAHMKKWASRRKSDESDDEDGGTFLPN
jgi:protein-arginine kinase activator protein McsA